jgi:hypothetical protein
MRLFLPQLVTFPAVFYSTFRNSFPQLFRIAKMDLKRPLPHLPKPKEIKKKVKTTTTEITTQSHPNYNKQITDILDGTIA